MGRVPGRRQFSHHKLRAAEPSDFVVIRGGVYQVKGLTVKLCRCSLSSRPSRAMNRWFPQCLAQFAARLGRKLGMDLSSSRRLTLPRSHWPSLFLVSHAGALSSAALSLLCFAAATASSVAAIPIETRPGANPLSAAERGFVRAAEPLFKQFCFDC